MTDLCEVVDFVNRKTHLDLYYFLICKDDLSLYANGRTPQDRPLKRCQQSKLLRNAICRIADRSCGCMNWVGYPWKIEPLNTLYAKKSYIIEIEICGKKFIFGSGYHVNKLSCEQIKQTQINIYFKK